jgi:protein TonB
MKVVPIKMVSEIDQGLHAPTKIPKNIEVVKEDAPPPSSGMGVAGMGGMGTGGSGVLGMGAGSGGPKIDVKPARPVGPARISSGVVAGLKIAGSQPVYPPIARAAHMQGSVTLHAVISKTGTIEKLEAISGPEMLKGAALDAVKGWRYKPYLLNGEPTEVDTTVIVNFNLNGG